MWNFVLYLLKYFKLKNNFELFFILICTFQTLRRAIFNLKNNEKRATEVYFPRQTTI